MGPNPPIFPQYARWYKAYRGCDLGQYDAHGGHTFFAMRPARNATSSPIFALRGRTKGLSSFKVVCRWWSASAIGAPHMPDLALSLALTIMRRGTFP